MIVTPTFPIESNGSYPIMSHSILKRNRRQTQHAYYLVNTMLSAFQLKSPITAVLWPS